MDLAMLSPDYAEIYFMISKISAWEKETDQTKVMLEIIKTFGEIDFLKGTTELTKLSMILGDSTKYYNAGAVMDELRKAESTS